MTRTLRTLFQICIVVFVLPCILAADVKRDPLITEDKVSESLEDQKQAVGRFGPRSMSKEKETCGEKKVEDDNQKDASNKTPGITHATINEAQRVWAEAKQALIDQLYEQIKDDEQAVNDEAVAVTSVQRCVQTASAAGLEARAQAKVINMLSRNSKELIEHIDHIEQVAQEELVNVEERVIKYKEKLQDLRIKITQADKDLVAIQVTGVLKPLTRLRRLADRRLGQRFGTVATSKHRTRRSLMSNVQAEAPPTALKRQWQSENEAQQVWLAAKQALIDQLEDQIKEDEAAVEDESAAMESVQRCIQTSVAAGLEARQQSKIIKLLAKNSKVLVQHIDEVEQIANSELVGTEARLGQFKEDLEKLRDRMTVAQKEMLEIQECGKVKPLQALRRHNSLKDTSKSENKEEVPVVRKRRAMPLKTARMDEYAMG